MSKKIVSISAEGVGDKIVFQFRLNNWMFMYGVMTVGDPIIAIHASFVSPKYAGERRIDITRHLGKMLSADTAFGVYKSMKEEAEQSWASARVSYYQEKLNNALKALPQQVVKDDLPPFDTEMSCF